MASPGDQNDMLSRLRSLLPPRWFADATPILDGLLSGLASTASWSFGQIRTVQSQTRIASATGAILDLIAQDFFGARVARRPNEADTPFRTRIQREMLRERATRGSVVSVLTDLTGRTPRVFEPAHPSDTGAYGLATGYGSAGGWGSLSLPFQALVTAYRPQGQGIAAVRGYGATSAGYGAGPIQYASLAQVQSQATDADIHAAIAGVMPAAATAWTAISN